MVPFANINDYPVYDFDESIDPRIIYIADKGNHCIRRILVKQANVDTFAGVCGTSGFKDGIFTQNLLNAPELVAADHNGTVYIWDSGNHYMRIVDPVTKIMRTMIHGSCHLDYMTNKPPIRVPFHVQLKPMLCFKSWIKTEGEPTTHFVTLPRIIEILDPSMIIKDYDYGSQN